ncbi:MAG TPA: DUF5666 domain-containing protein [Candidatus Saccharimonadales bacterium]|nr:DUF5666 domain-containing protein [Candidatus Saccharimonadales bacterium]
MTCKKNRESGPLLLLTFCGALAFLSASAAAQTPSSTTAQVPAGARPVGTIKAISGNTITLASDAGADVTVQVQDGAKFLRIAPGQTSLKDATVIQLSDIQVGDRVLVRGKLGDDGKTVLASSVIAMKQEDIAQKQAKERDEWQRHGVGGLVGAVDPVSNTITISMNSPGATKNIVVHLSKTTVLRRYAPSSVKFDDAKPAPLDQVKPGDQLRARGNLSGDGTELVADEIVSGTFRNIAGTISAIDAVANTLTVHDLAAKKDVLVKITPESQLRKLSQPIAARIALRLKAGNGEGGAAAEPGATPSLASPAKPADRTAARSGAAPEGRGGMGRQGAPDLQQAISRMPAATLADLQKGDAVLLVATQGIQNGEVTAITLLGGVEPILEASPQSSASTILSPWSLGSGAPGGEAGNP